MSLGTHILVGLVGGALLAALWVGGLFATLRPWAAGRVAARVAAGSALLRMAVLLAGLAALAALSLPAIVAATATLLLLRPVLVRALAPRLERPGEDGEP